MIHRFITLLITICCVVNAGAQLVSNVSEVRTGDRMIITYDLHDRADVWVLVSHDNGLTYSSIAHNIDGDAGCDIAPGTGRRLVCDLAKESKNGSTDRMKVKIWADNPGVFTVTPYIESVSAGPDGGYAYVVKSNDGALLNRQVYAEAGGSFSYRTRPGRLIPVKNFEEKWGAIDLQGNEVVPMIYDNVQAWRNDFVTAHKGDNISLIDLTGRVVLSGAFWEIERRHDYIVASSRSDDKHHIYTLTGEKLISCDYCGGENYGSVFVLIDRSRGYRLYDIARRQYLTPYYQSLEIDGEMTEFRDKNGKAGMLSTTTGKVLFQGDYGSLWGFRGHDYAVATDNNDRSILIDRQGKTIYLAPDGYELSASLNLIDSDRQKSVYTLENTSTGQYGVADASGNFIIPPVYDRISNHLGGDIYMAEIEKNHSRVSTHIYNLKSRKKIFECDKDHSLWTVDSDNNIVVSDSRTHNYSLYDGDGNLLIADVADITNHVFTEYYAKIPFYLVCKEKGQLNAVYDARRKKFITDAIIEADLWDGLGDGVLAANLTDYKTLFYNTLDGTYFISNLGHSYYGGEGKIWVSSGYGANFKRMLVDSKCNVLIDNFRDYDINSYHDGICRVKDRLTEKWGYIDLEGHELFPCVLESCSDFSGGLGRIIKNGRYGFVDATGHMAIPAIYDAASDFENGVAVVGINGFYGAVDSSGREVIPCYYKDEYTAKSLAGNPLIVVFD